MIALIKVNRTGKQHIATQTKSGKAFVTWVTSGGSILLASWVEILDVLPVDTIEETKDIYPEYWV